jgi:hypothetical protein
MNLIHVPDPTVQLLKVLHSTLRNSDQENWFTKILKINDIGHALSCA